MATKTTKRTVTVPRRPERKWGPFHGGVGVAVWLNEVETEEGKKFSEFMSPGIGRPAGGKA